MRSPLLPRLRTRLQRSETVAPVALAVTVGTMAAVGAIVLRQLIGLVKWLFFDLGSRIFAGFGPEWAQRLHFLLAPAIGRASPAEPGTASSQLLP